jgi:SAM-dependent methyltransferase
VLLPHLRVAGHAGPKGLIPTTDRFGTSLSNVVRCPACSHMQLERMPSDAELGEAYGEAASEDYVEEEAGQTERARRMLDRIERHTARGAMVDLGCWIGFLLAAARERGWETVGIEPSEFASSYARERFGLDVRTADLLAADLPEGRFQAAVMGDVIEHLPRPGEALDRVARLLAPDGVLSLALPNAGSPLARAMGARWWSVLPTHVHYFTRPSLYTLLRRHGFEPLEAETDPKPFTVRYYLTRIAGYSQPASRALVAAATGAGIADRLWAPDFRDRMAVIARSVR